MYESSILKCNVEDDGCPICLFLGGNRTGGVLMSVLKTLDKSLAESERDVSILAQALAERSDK